MKTLKVLSAGIVVLILSGIICEKIGERQDRRRYPQIGRSVNIGGRALNVFCSGEGGPSVIFDTYGHMSGYSWSAVQREVSKFTRACWYDRAAYGWSDSAPMPRTFQSVASDLHALLNAAAVPEPYVLVGGGDAASHIRVYHGMYPGEVAGVVMVNANGVDDPHAEIPDSEKGVLARRFGSFAPHVRRAACVIYPIFAQVGAVRLASIFQNPRRTDSLGLRAEQETELDFLSDNPTAKQGSELCAREESMQQVRAAGNLGNVPLVVLASEPDSPSAASARDPVEAAWNRNQIEQVQPGLARLSLRGHLVLAKGAVAPAAVVDAVRNVVTEVRGERQK